MKRSAVMACIAEGVSERAPERGVQYAGFIDPSGGSSDSMTLAIGYRDREGKTVLAYSRASVPPFSPSAVCTEFAEILKAYGIHSVKSDKYGGRVGGGGFSHAGHPLRAIRRSKIGPLFVALAADQ